MIPRRLLSVLALVVVLTVWPAISGGAPATAQSPIWHCWNPTNVPDPCYLSLNSVDHHAPGEGWAVGDGGRILRQQAGSWASVDSPTTKNLVDVASVSATSAWAVGGNSLVRWDGTAWHLANSPSPYEIFTISMLSERDGRLGTGNGGVVGSYGAFYRWDGSTWAREAVSTTSLAGNVVDEIRDIAMLPDGTAWATGYTRDAGMFVFYYSAMFQWDKTSRLWHHHKGASATGSITLQSDRDGWVSSPGGSGRRLGWDPAANGPVWRPFDGGFFGSFAMLSALDGWTASGKAVRRWNGNAWTLAAELPDNVAALSASGPADAWAVGDAGLMARWDGESWTLIAANTRAPTLDRVEVLSDQEAWAVGAAGSIARYDGTSWNDMPSPTKGSLRDVAFRTASDGWAVGQSGTLVRFDGSAWTTAAPLVTDTLRAVALDESLGGWAVGDRGTILRLGVDGWSQVTSPTRLAIEDVSILSPTDAWAVGGGGGDGVSLRWNGTEWVDVPLPTRDALLRVAMMDAEYGWAATSGGRLLNWDGGGWSAPASAERGVIGDIVLTARGVGWAVGTDASVLQLSGDKWSVAAQGLGGRLSDLDVDATGNGWATGQNSDSSTGARQLFVRLGADRPSGAPLTPLPSPTLTPVPTRTPLPSRTPTPGPATATSMPAPPAIYLPALVRRAARDGSVP